VAVLIWPGLPKISTSAIGVFVPASRTTPLIDASAGLLGDGVCARAAPADSINIAMMFRMTVSSITCS
jgi:hypothetical protein